MTDDQRRAAVLDLITTFTAANTASRAAAREVLIRGGIYTAEGKLRPEYGGPEEPPKSQRDA
jgi:hypothetical protein